MQKKEKITLSILNFCKYYHPIGKKAVFLAKK